MTEYKTLSDEAQAAMRGEVIQPAEEIGSDPYNNGYTHEALHAAHIACNLWDSHVVETRCAEEFPDVREAIEKASDAIYYVYQLIGQKFKDVD